MAASINITYTNSEGKKGQKAITNVSESATNNELYYFARDFIGLSNLNFSSVKKIVTTEIETPNGGE